MTPRPSEVRYRVQPGDVPPEKAARRMHLTPKRFAELLPQLRARGFPAPDPDTGNFDLDAIDLWRRSRNPRLFGLTTAPALAQPEPADQSKSMGDRFIEAKERGRRRGTS